MPLHQLKDVAHYGNRNWPFWVDETNPDTLVPIVRDPDDILVIVAGGDGRHSAWLGRMGRHADGHLGDRPPCLRQHIFLGTELPPGVIVITLDLPGFWLRSQSNCLPFLGSTSIDLVSGWVGLSVQQIPGQIGCILTALSTLSRSP